MTTRIYENDVNADADVAAIARACGLPAAAILAPTTPDDARRDLGGILERAEDLQLGLNAGAVDNDADQNGN